MKGRITFFAIVFSFICSMIALSEAIDAKKAAGGSDLKVEQKKPVTMADFDAKWTRNYNPRLMDQKILDEVNRVLHEEDLDRKPLTMAQYDQLLDESYDRVRLPVVTALRDEERAKAKLERAEKGK